MIWTKVHAMMCFGTSHTSLCDVINRNKNAAVPQGGAPELVGSVFLRMQLDGCVQVECILCLWHWFSSSVTVEKS
jgi:hypothetical protein